MARRPMPDEIQDDVTRLKDELAAAKATIASLSSNLKNEAVGRTQDAIHSAVDATASRVNSTVESISSAASTVGERTAAAARTGMDGVTSATSEIEAFARRNPIAALASAFMVGIVIGMASRPRS